MNPTTAEDYTAPPSSAEHPLPLVARAHAVTQVTPAKKITFFKSGDPQFTGVKMAINRRSFKSFSALMDDLSRKVPLPFGVRTITTPRGTHCINRLEQLEDGGRYICSDKKYVQPIAPSGPVRKAGIQRASRPVSARKHLEQERQEDEYSPAHFKQIPKLRKKIMLVKNGDPTFRRSIILNRRNARNFKTLLEDASDLLQYTVRRLYTVEGHRVENIQAVLQSPNILICVGREPFKPIRAENMRKSIAEKLPGLGTHPSINNESMDSKKNDVYGSRNTVYIPKRKQRKSTKMLPWSNFGLKAKKSVIHPRSASSNKTRFSLSSEKSYPNGINMSPVNSGFASFSSACPHTKSEDTAHSLVNDDIEKRVHVNKDGSLSVEMKVRFRLLNEETLQWSTQIKKSSTLGKSKCEQLCLYEEEGMESKQEVNPEMFSETDDSFYPCDADSYSSKIKNSELEDMYCSHCGMQCQEYDIWKNPMHANPQEDFVKRGTWQTQTSASSTSSHCKLMYNEKTSIDSLHTTSSEEYTEHIVQKSSSYSERRDNRETRVRYSAVSRCTSQSGHSTAASNTDLKAGNGHTNACLSQHQSYASINSQASLKNQDLVTKGCNGKKNLRSEGGSFEEPVETSPPICSHSETKEHNCNRRGSIISQSSVQSIKSNESIYKRESIDTESNRHEVAGDRENDEFLFNRVASRTGLSESENCSTQASSHSKNTGKRGKKSIKSHIDYQGSRRSLCSSILKQNSDILLEDDRSHGQCEESEILKSCSPTISNKSSCKNTEKPKWHLHSNHSLESLSSDTALCHTPEVKKTTNCHDRCDEFSESHLEDKQRDEFMDTAEEDEKCSIHNSRSSNKSGSMSPKYNSINCLENEKCCSSSCRVSLNFKKMSKDSESRDTGDNDSHKSSVTSLQDKKQNGNIQKDDEYSRASSSETDIHIPSPPKGKPTNRQLRSVKYRSSSNSLCSDTVKIIDEEKPGSTRSSTPESKNIGASRGSTETCKKLKNTMSGHNSTDEIQNTKKRKNSSSSSKWKLKGEAIDNDSRTRSSELIPSTLPNVTSEEVVHEWLRKIPSETMVVEYEAEESHTKECKETYSEPSESKAAKEKEEGNKAKNAVQEMQDSNEIQNQPTNINDVDNPETDACYKDEMVSSKVQANNIKCKSVMVEPISDYKSLPSNIYTSVQIMKALLRPLQDSKFDRSNSLPEVSPTMGRKLSNSAQVLIACLASLQLLDGGLPNSIEEANDLNKSKHNKLLNIFQALWGDRQTNTCVTNNKSANPSKMSSKHYSREDEITPVSSSGVDVNSGSGASGDGSVAGGGECTMTAEKVDEFKLSTTAVVAKDKNTMLNTEVDLAASEGCNEDNGKCTVELRSAVICGEVCSNKSNSCDVDENMNEKRMEYSNSNILEFEPQNGMDEYLKNGHVNDVNVDLKETMVSQEYSKDSMNILTHSENKPESNESNSQETNGTNFGSDDQSIVKSTSDSNEKIEPCIDKPSVESDPIWVLKLLKKIEKEFMTHYVDAMNEFKIRWNLEDNDNLDEMIAELKNEVGQRIQKSIENELKKIKTRAGQKMPMPPKERRRSSLQAEERRRHLQTMHKRSVLQSYKVGGTNEVSSETDEEDLTFSASFGDDFDELGNDEFCPCEKCIKKKKAQKLAKPKIAAIDAPIMRAFDLHQILKTKRENNEVKNNDILPLLEQSNKELDDKGVRKNSLEANEESHSVAGSSCCSSITTGTKSQNSTIEKQMNNPEDRSSLQDENEECATDDLKCEEVENQEDADTVVNNDPDIECKLNDELGKEPDNTNIDNIEMLSRNASVEAKRMSMECLNEIENPDFSDEEKQSEQENDPLDIIEDHTVDEDQLSKVENNDTKEVSGDGDEQTTKEQDDDVQEACSDNEVIETCNYIEENENQDCMDALEPNGSLFQKSCLGQSSIIAHNGSCDDADEQYTEMNNNKEETASSGQSNSPSSKQAQMYPDSSSDDEDRASACASPYAPNKTETKGRLRINNKESIEESETKRTKSLDDEIIEQDDLDF